MPFFGVGGQNDGSGDKDLLAAAGKVDASCNVATGEVIPAPFRLSGFLLCNIPIVATMLFTKSVYVQVIYCTCRARRLRYK